MNENEEEKERLIEPESALPAATLDTVPETIRAAVGRIGWSDLMPVQARAIPYVLAGRDIMVQSRTGSGKTGAFALPILSRIDTERHACQALILVPTRELARQVAHDTEVMAGDSGVRVVAVYGGAGYGAQVDAFKKGAHIVVGTPGRILDHLMRRSLSLAELDILVFDEADRMLSIGFYPDMKEIQRYLPHDRNLNGLMFSATFPPHVMRLAGEFLREPELLSLSGSHVHVADSLHIYCEVPAMDKDRCLMRLIEIENPVQAMIFCNTKANVHYVTAVLQNFGYDADELSADLSQGRRDEVLTHVRAGELRFLVATDVAARGIDIPDLSHVFLYESPEDQETYIHRAGRTGRAGATGTIISLCDVIETLALKRIASKFKIDLQRRPVPTDEDVAAAVGHRLMAQLEARLRSRSSLIRERIQRLVPLVRSLSQSEDDQELLAMLLDEFYMSTIKSHMPQPSGQPAEHRPSREPRRGKPRPRNRPGDDEPRAAEASEDSAAPAEAAGEEGRQAKKRRRRRRRKPSGNGNGGDSQPSGPAEPSGSEE